VRLVAELVPFTFDESPARDQGTRIDAENSFAIRPPGAAL